MGEFRQQRAAEAERLEDLAEADLHAGGDIAAGFCNYFGCYGVVRRPGVVGAKIVGDAGGARGEADGSELEGQVAAEMARFAEAVLQTAVVVVDGAEAGGLVVQYSIEVHKVGVRGLRQVGCDSTGDYGIEEVACSEGLNVGAEEVFLEARELGQAEGEAGVVAERAQVAEVVGEAFVLEGEGAEVGGSHGARGGGDRFERGAVRPREGDG